MNKRKLKAWQTIHDRFKELSVKEIKQQWKCMKLEAKNALSNYNRAGGGSKPPSPTAETIEILQLIPLEFDTDINQYDSNSQSLMATEEVAAVEQHSEIPATVEVVYDTDIDSQATLPSTSGIGSRKRKIINNEDEYKKAIGRKEVEIVRRAAGGGAQKKWRIWKRSRK
ncbi:hypothetical protein C0J52_23812 [Blattella germanica]|nr:hypothetical protein C0J52_23812 [Blattella germanica]